MMLSPPAAGTPSTTCWRSMQILVDCPGPARHSSSTPYRGPRMASSVMGSRPLHCALRVSCAVQLLLCSCVACTSVPGMMPTHLLRLAQTSAVACCVPDATE